MKGRKTQATWLETTKGWEDFSLAKKLRAARRNTARRENTAKAVVQQNQWNCSSSVEPVSAVTEDAPP